MGEIVQKLMENLTEDVIEFKRSKLFEETEINVFIRRRREFYYKINGVTKHLPDYLNAIRYEYFMLSEIAARRHKKNLPSKKQQLDFIILKRIKQYYENALLRYSDDYKLSEMYFRFLERNKTLHQAATYHIKTMIEKFQFDPKVFQLAAEWFKEASKKEALKIIHRGLARHPGNKPLYIDAIEIELKEPQDREEITLKTYVESIIKDVNEYRFLLKILKILECYPRTIEVQNFIIDKLFEKYPDEEVVWHAVAQRECQGFYYKAPDEESKKSTKHNIKRCVAKYKEGIAKLPKDKQPALWELYLETLIDMQKQNPNVANVIKANSLWVALEEAKKAGIKLDEIHYAAWIDICGENDKFAVQLLEEGTKERPHSRLLWELYLKIKILNDKVKEVDEVFEKAIIALGSAAESIWDMIIDYHLLRSSNPIVEMLYRRAINEPYEKVSSIFKPRYLTWLLLIKGIKEARKAYDEIASKPPFCKELHEEMARTEAMEGSDKNEHWAKCLQIQCEQFGKDDVDVWISLIQLYRDERSFEMNEKINKIYQDAVKVLPEVMLNDFKEKFAALDSPI